jgi:predicted permease
MRRLIDGLWQDLRVGARALAKNPAFLAVAGLSLALGIGANAAIFQLLDAVRLRTLPVPHPEQLVRLKIADNDHCCNGSFSARNSDFTYAQWEQIRAHQRAFSNIFAWGDTKFDLTHGGEVRFAEGAWVSGEFFRTLNVQPLLGRLISNEDDHVGCGSPGVVISYPFWQRQFGGSAQAIGKSVSLSGHDFQVMGVTPVNFFGIEVGRSFDVAVPVCAEALIEKETDHIGKRRDWWLAIIGRLNPGWNVTRAAAQANAISRAVFEPTVPANERADQAKWYVQYKLTAEPAPAGVSSLRRRYDEPLLLLLAIAGLVLLIACANLANLMLARATVREREMAVRLAIGASRARLIRQLLAESFLLAGVGTCAGILLAQLLSRYLVGFLTTTDNPMVLQLQPDWRFLAFTGVVGLITCIVFGLAPAFRATRTSPVAAMKASGRGVTADRERFGLRRGLVITQVALSLVLLVGALLFVGSLRNLLTLDAGFRQDGLVIAGIDVSRLDFKPERRGILYRDLLTRIRGTAGVESAATARIVQVSGSGWNEDVEILGQPNHGHQVPWFDSVSAGYFHTMGTPLLAGRDFGDQDTPATQEVAIVNEEFVKKFLGGANPIGRQVRPLRGPGETQHVYQIVGLVKSSKYQSMRDEVPPIVFVADSQEKTPDLGTNFIVRSSAPLGGLTASLKSAILAESPAISIEFTTFNRQVGESLLRERLLASLSGFFGFLAAILATVGLYGVLSYMVARRRNEIGIRMAVGANQVSVLMLVMREASVLLAAGLAIGTGLAIAGARAAGSLLFGLKPNDPATILLAVALLTIVAGMAALVPAVRASRLQPMSALRDE